MDGLARAPDCIKAAISGYRWIQSTGGESGASVYRLVRLGHPALYLKFGTGAIAGEIANEMTRLRWLASFISVPEIREYFYSVDQAWLLTAAMPGINASESLTAHPGARSEIVKVPAQFLRDLHALPSADRPFTSDHALRMADARRNMDAGLVEESDFGSMHEGWTRGAGLNGMLTLIPLPFDRVVAHGDFSLDNILLKNGRVAGCIDVGRAGLADPYQDLTILWNNLEEFGKDLQGELFSAYGIADPGARKMRFHLCLDEFF